MQRQIKKILIIRPDAIGDVLLITPAISLLRQKFPQAHISILVKAYTKDAIANNPDINKIILDPISEKQKSVFAFAKEIKAKQFDLSVHFYNEFPYALLAFLARIPYRLGDSSKILFGYLYNFKTGQDWGNPNLHEVEQNLLLLKPLGIDITNPPPLKIVVPNDFGKKLLAENNINQDDLIIGINLGTGKSNRPWLAESFVQTIDLLNEKLGAKIILVGGPKDKEKEAFILSKVKNKPLSQVGIPPHLPELISIISQCKFFLTVDTGLMHIAAALKIPTVALFPVKTMLPIQWGPWQNPHVIMRKLSACQRRCQPQFCPYDDCLREIKPEEVLQAVEELLAGRGNQTLEQARQDWFKKSMHILFVADNPQKLNHPLIQKLNEGCFHVSTLKSASILGIRNLLINREINIIHHLGDRLEYRITMAKLLSLPWVAIPPLVVNQPLEENATLRNLLAAYQEAFRKRKYF